MWVTPGGDNFPRRHDAPSSVVAAREFPLIVIYTQPRKDRLMSLIRRLMSVQSRSYLAGFGNALVLLLQLIQIVQTHKVTGLSIPMFVGFLFIQVTFMEVGWRLKQYGQFLGMLCSAVITIAIIILTLQWR